MGDTDTGWMEPHREGMLHGDRDCEYLTKPTKTSVMWALKRDRPTCDCFGE